MQYTDIIKLAGKRVWVFLVRLYQECLRTGFGFAECKKAVIIPVSKSGQKINVRHYRPVSVTCYFCKGMDSIVKSLGEWEGNVLSKVQHGTRV